MGNPITARAQVDRVVAASDIVKVSDEDLRWLRSDEPINSQVRRWLDMGPAIVIVTRGEEGASAFLKDARRIDVTAPKVEVVDTVGAGDAFMAGLIDGLWSQGCLGAAARDDLATVSTDIVSYLLTRCVAIAAVTVSRAGASPPTRAELGEASLS